MGQWDSLKSGSVRRGVRNGLKDDLKFSDSAVVDLIRETLSNGIVSADELDDLTTVLMTSRTLSVRSKMLLKTFVSQVNATVDGKGPFRRPTERHRRAAEAVCNFLRRHGRAYFPKLDRDEVGVGLLMRIAKPGLMSQGYSSLCGPTAMLYSLATDQPMDYVRYATELYERGEAKMGTVLVRPGKDARNYLPESWEMPQVDWLTAASLRDSEDWFLDYDNFRKEAAGTTLPNELASWFVRAGIPTCGT